MDGIIFHQQASNSNMASSIQELSTTCGQLQAKEQELSTIVKLKVQTKNNVTYYSNSLFQYIAIRSLLLLSLYLTMS